MTSAATNLKQRAHELIDQLPDESTLAEMAEPLAVVEDIEAGLAESDSGLGADTETLRKQYRVAE